MEIDHERATDRNQYGPSPSDLEEAKEIFRWVEFALDVERAKLQRGELNDAQDMSERYRWTVENVVESWAISELEDGDCMSMYNDELDKIWSHY